MLKLGRVTKVRVLFLVLVFVFNFDFFKFSAAILEKGLLSLSTRAHFRPYFDGGNLSSAQGSGIASVSGDDSSLELLGLELTTPSTSYSGLNWQLHLLNHFASQFPPRKVMRSLAIVHFLSGGCWGCWHSIESYSKLPMCALIIFVSFLSLEGDLLMEKVWG